MMSTKMLVGRASPNRADRSGHRKMNEGWKLHRFRRVPQRGGLQTGTLVALESDGESLKPHGRSTEGRGSRSAVRLSFLGQAYAAEQVKSVTQSLFAFYTLLFYPTTQTGTQARPFNRIRTLKQIVNRT